MGLSGKTRIHTRPPRRICRLIARRPASIWRAVSRPRLVAFRPNSPKDTWVPRVAKPLLRPLCSLRYFLRAGCNIIYLLQRRKLGDEDHDHGGDYRVDHHVGDDDAFLLGPGLLLDFHPPAQARPSKPKP